MWTEPKTTVPKGTYDDHERRISDLERKVYGYKTGIIEYAKTLEGTVYVQNNGIVYDGSKESFEFMGITVNRCQAKSIAKFINETLEEYK